MESLNINNNSNNNDTMIIRDDVDECALQPYPCGKSALCYNTVGSYQCFCRYDMTPLNPHEDCYPNETISNNNSNTDGGVFSRDHLYNIIKPVIAQPSNVDLEQDLLKSSSYNTTNSSTSTDDFTRASINTQTWLPNTALIGIVVAGVICSLLFITLACLILKRQRANVGGSYKDKFPFCCCYWQPPKSTLGLKALRKSAILGSQQFTANPNYYATPPEIALLKSLLHLEISGEKLVFLDIIGEGCFGKVFKGLFHKTENEICEVAVKILKDNSTNETQVDFLREVEIMSSFNHLNILGLLGVVVIENGSTPWMVFEYMEYGDLAELLRGNSPHLWSVSQTPCKITADDLPWLASQVARGMEYLSSQHFVHRDLATRNCLVGKDLAVKISDFGMSRDIYTCDYYKIGGSRMLPIRWMAPESVMYGKFTLESDIWSYGIVLWEIFAYGKQPYYGHTNEEVVKLIRQRTLLVAPEDCPQYVAELMEKCWESNPYDRIKFQEINAFLHSHCTFQKETTIQLEPTERANNTYDNEVPVTSDPMWTTSNPRYGNQTTANTTTTNEVVDHQNYLVPRSANTH